MFRRNIKMWAIFCNVSGFVSKFRSFHSASSVKTQKSVILNDVKANNVR